MKTLSVKINETHDEKLQAIANQLEMSKSSVIRMLILEKFELLGLRLFGE